ncbi:hypothetical protein EW146_g9100 [Bondarzewia mesenterica]|uniref:BRCT domain-containing protein n=1 Tax=Bondarzewia mesenterica TaxID=1095465 RepID=A0A4S4L8Z5_9AGAM|nr:hypothetical protein EW146_g9100 [Bondarzewia mesenterica]
MCHWCRQGEGSVHRVRARLELSLRFQSSLFAKAGEMGADTTSDFTDRVTHLIADDHGGAKYMCALSRKIPIMKPSWIFESFKVWQRGDDVVIEDSIEQHRLPTFTGVILSLSGIEDVARRTEINRLLTQKEGIYVKNIERPVRVTHLLCSGDEETDKMRYARKFNARGEASIRLVWEEWFWDSLEFGGRFDEKGYKVEHPRPERKQVPEVPPTPIAIVETSRTTSDEPISIPNSNSNLNAQDDTEEEEIANARRVPTITLQVWESLLGSRGYKRVGGQLVRTGGADEGSEQAVKKDKGKGKAIMPAIEMGEGDEPKSHSALRTFTRTHSFAPSRVDAVPSRQPFRKSASTFAIAPRTASQTKDAGGGAGPSAQVFEGMRFRARGEAWCASVREAVEGCGGRWVDGQEDDDVDDVDFILVRLVSGSKLFREEPDDILRGKYRTECWLEGCLARERVCAPEEHVTFVPLRIQTPVAGAEAVTMSPSGLDVAEDMWVKRLSRALGITHAPTFSRASTHLLCPSAKGAKFEKAREWGTPIVVGRWLDEAARTGIIPPIFDYLIVDAPIDLKGKGRAKEDIGMMDITNDSQAYLPNIAGQTISKPASQSRLTLGAASPLPLPVQPQDDPEAISFGRPKLLLAGCPDAADLTMASSPPPSRSPSAPRSRSYSPTVPSSTADSGVLPRPILHPNLNSNTDRCLVPTQKQPEEERVPSSSTPSPMKLPSVLGMRGNGPAQMQMGGVSSEAARALQESLTTLLGKRTSAEDVDGASGHPQSRQNSDTGKNIVPHEHADSLQDMNVDRYDPAMVSYECDDIAVLAGAGVSMEASVMVTYEDPGQLAEQKRLMKLLGNSGESMDGKETLEAGTGPKGKGKGKTQVGKAQVLKVFKLETFRLSRTGRDCGVKQRLLNRQVIKNCCCLQVQQSVSSLPHTFHSTPATSADEGPVEPNGAFKNLTIASTMEFVSDHNALNRSMQGLWSAHRRKVNLNAPPIPSTSTPPIPSPSTEETPQPQPENDAIPSATAMSSTEPTESRPPVSNGKRKVRSMRGEESSKRTRLAASSSSRVAKEYTPPSVRLSDLGGVEACVEKMLELVAMPLSHPEIYLHTGVHPPRGVLLHGPPGCGKTMLANAIGGELGVPFISISAPSIVSGMSGESEKTLRETFEEAKRVAPCLLFIDEIDAITPKRESAQREMERRIVAQFLTCMDELSWEKTDNKPVLVIGATNRPDALDAALRRAGRFDHEISMGVPDDEARAQILRVLCSKLRLDGAFDFMEFAKATPGYVGADLSALTGAAGIVAVKRIFRQLSDGTLVLPDIVEQTIMAIKPDADGDSSMQMDGIPPTEPVSVPSAPTPAPFSSLTLTTTSSIAHFLQAHPSPLTPSQLAPLCITSADFFAALKQVQPSAQREGFATVPNVTWADVGALHATREELHMAVVQPIRRPELFKTVGIEAPCGVLLWGPPGCGKTLLAKAVANESRANFISVKGPELLNKYVGESERAVRQVFSRARASSPCVVFFDELDALVPRRDENLSESSARVVNTLLTELDGLDSRRGVFVLGATNRPDMIDPAMCRPGRLDKLLYVDLPTADERVEIVRTMVRKVPLSPDGAREGLDRLTRDRGEGYSGADLAAVVREAGVLALRRTLGALEMMDEGIASAEGDVREDAIQVGVQDFERAMEKVGPSVSRAQRRKYEALREKFAGMPVSARVGEEKGKDKASNDARVM